MKKDSPILLHVPHASMIIPKEERVLFCLPYLYDELLKMTDRYCDELFTGYDSIIFPVSRLVCDPERFRDDEKEYMSRIGMGAVYTKSSSGELLRRITDEKREGLLQRYYDSHHQRLTAAVEAKLQIYGRCLIVDGHSFHPTPLPYEPDQEPDRPDFCIGTDLYHTPSWLSEAAVGFLKAEGFSVELNRPYSGSIVPMKFYQKDNRVSSIMIEVNRRLYLNPYGMRGKTFIATMKVVSHLLEHLSDEYDARENKESHKT